MEKQQKNRAVFIDRDGVINRSIVRDGKPYPPDHVCDLEVLPGVREAIQLLKKAGFLTIVVTNQPDVATGKQKRETVEEMNFRLINELSIDDFFVCYHQDSDHCDCRKPLPGMIIQAKSRYGIDLSKSYMVGDRWRDIEAGNRANCTTFFVDYQYSESKIVKPDYRVSSLLEAASRIIELAE